MSQFADFCLKEWHQPTCVTCCKCGKMARITTFPKEGGGNNYCTEHAKDEILAYLAQVNERTE